MGAVAGGCIQVLANELIEEHQVQSREVEKIAAKAIEEASWRESFYRAERAAPDLHDSTVILVDDGLATGSSMLAAAHYVNSFKPEKVIAAAPVGTEEACSRLKNFTDACVCLATPRGFHAVGQCYQDFTQVTDDEVRRILEQNDQRAGLEQQGPLTGALP